MAEAIDLIVLTREAGALRPEVEAGLRRQDGVRLIVHRVVGAPQPGDASRWETIARARNRGKRLGTTPWVMFLDDDVVLERDCVITLLRELRNGQAYGALASNYLGERLTANAEPAHVAMGATLFRRSALDRIEFRWTADRCECQCCCDDLRRQLIGITYLPAARSRHLGLAAGESHAPARTAPRLPRGDDRPAAAGPGFVLAAFDRHHFPLFTDQFLASLRASGNAERVLAVGYGLTLHQQQWLARQDGLEGIIRAGNDTHAAIRRLQDFPDVLRELPPGAPVAYWDAGDCLFQSRLQPLWRLVAGQPGKLLCCGEPSGYPENPAVVSWTRTIRDETARARVFDLFSTHAWLNSGFAAGTARVMWSYFEAASRIRAEVLAGTADFGDQTALNYYCHSQPQAWQQIESGWNYCLCRRPPGECHIRSDGLFEARDGTPIHVVHGNASSLWTVPGLARARGRIRRMGNRAMVHPIPGRA